MKDWVTLKLYETKIVRSIYLVSTGLKKIH